MRHCICLCGLLRIHLNLRRLVVFLDIHFLILVHFMLDPIMPLFGVTSVILLTMILIRVLIMHVMHNSISNHPGTTLMLS